MQDGKYLAFSQDKNVGIITFNRPDIFNVVSWELLEEMEEFQKQIEKDPTVKALVINANGDHFSAGIDLRMLQQLSSAVILERLTWLQNVYSRWHEWWIPVIAAVHGLCYGSAMELILGCDIRIAAEDARFSIPEVRFALAPDMGGTTRLTRLVGTGQAKRMIMGCEEIDAAEALRIGLVEIVVPREKLLERALQMAHKMNNLPPVAIRFAKKGINVAAESSVAAGLLFEQAQSTFCCGTEDQKEAVAAFFEKRPPIFQGK